MQKYTIKRAIRYIGSIVLFMFFFPGIGWAAQLEEEAEIMRLFYKEDELVVSAVRYEKPAWQVAENVTVITAEEMERINAHTIVDVLNTIPGLQVTINSSPAVQSSVHIQGSEPRHVTVIIDGIPLNNLGDNLADVAALPVQNVERIEIIKGPGSSAWGSSLGGVINIVTKSPEDRPVSGTLSNSYGQDNTGDFRTEVSGKVDDFGYYIYYGRLSSDGLRPNTDASLDNFYTKLTYDISDDADAYFSLGYYEGERGLSEIPQFFIFDSDDDHIYATLCVNYRISENADFSLSAWTMNQDVTLTDTSLVPFLPDDTAEFEDERYGGSLQFRYGHEIHSFVLGADADTGELKSNDIAGGSQDLDEWGVYANDTMTLGQVTVTPGLRYDYTSTNDDFVSPSLGITYATESKETIFRVHGARGFSIPPLSATFGDASPIPPQLLPNPDLEVEKVWSVQAGVETSALKYVKVRGAFFWHRVRDAIVTVQVPNPPPLPPSGRAVNEDKIRRQGFEIEAETIPFHHLSLWAGFLYMDVENRKTGETVKNIPEYTWDLAARYLSDRFKAVFKGRYVWWNAEGIPGVGNGSYDDFVWDLNLMATLYRKDTVSAEAFFTVHNVFNGSQYPLVFFKNPRRWVEGGLRVRF
jgi:vitamin B12 transporter